ncbi:MAG: GlsB/YeaQ/YmgE family stress response membrane protein, partial [Acidobacteria bacterium]
MHLLWMIVVGLIVGAIAKLLMPGRDPGGIIVTMLLGIAGSVVAGFLGRAIGLYQQGEPVGFIAS